MPESATRALESQFRHPRLESRGFEPQLFGGAADAANPPPGAVEHALDVFPLDVGEPARCVATAEPGGKAIVKRGPDAPITARSTRLRSSRTFPGQGYRWSMSMLSFGIDSMRFPNAFENSSTKRHTSIGMSSVRSRSGGTRIGKTFSR